MLLICFGTRPEWLKIKPIVKLLERKTYRLLFTGQHTELLNDMDVDYRIQISSNGNRLDAIVANTLLQFPDGDFDSVLVQGDTASAYACALAAFHRSLKIYHLEAGLRTHDLRNPFPEEAYRQMISRITDIHLCPTELSQQYLSQERVNGRHIVVGNTSLDNLHEYRDKVVDDKKVLVTLHRRENHNTIEHWFSTINELAKQHSELEFILPIHPNPNVLKWKSILTNVKVVDPMEHHDLLSLMSVCSLIITDSGGIQEEASFLGKKAIVCRTSTERMEGVFSGHLFLCKTPDTLHEIFEDVLTRTPSTQECPFGDGYSAAKIINTLQQTGA